MCYLVQPRDRIFVKNYGYLSSTENMGKNIGENISKNLIRKCCQKLLDHAKQSGTEVLKTTKKTAEATCDLIGNKTTDVLRSKTLDLQQ